MRRVRHESPSTCGRRHGDRAQAGGHFAAHAPFRLEDELAAALHQRSIQVHYQPQFDLTSGRACGVEALARLTLSNGDQAEPTAFIPIAEQFGLIHELGRMMLNKACQGAWDWCRRRVAPLTLAVNVSALQIDAKFGPLIECTLKQHNFPAKQLELEITESALMVDADRTIGYLNEWRSLGVRIAIDDFGTGYSSLNYLTRLPVDRLKIDRTLVQRMTLDRKSVSVMRLILAVAAELGLDVIAEGVETEHELRLLTDMGCPKVQGFLLGRPVPARQARSALSKSLENGIESLIGQRVTAGGSHAA
jgi:EAL domain-containing protein (putative c-di-GMP-specific phosphodiesterase class I)